MGYTTDFSGQIAIEPPLSAEEIAYLQKFNRTRRMNTTKGPYYVERGGDFGQSHDADVIDYNHPPEGQPGLWCNWTPTDDGTAIEWDGGEKFYDSPEWMQYLIDHFIGHAPIAGPQLPFLKTHTLNGRIEAVGEDPDDRWVLIVEDNVVKVADALPLAYGDPKPVSRA